MLGDEVILHDELLAEPGAVCPSSSPSLADHGSATQRDKGKSADGAGSDALKDTIGLLAGEGGEMEGEIWRGREWHRSAD